MTKIFVHSNRNNSLYTFESVDSDHCKEDECMCELDLDYFMEMGRYIANVSRICQKRELCRGWNTHCAYGKFNIFSSRRSYII